MGVPSLASKLALTDFLNLLTPVNTSSNEFSLESARQPQSSFKQSIYIDGDQT
jgi:hypothetical protein